MSELAQEIRKILNQLDEDRDVCLPDQRVLYDQILDLLQIANENMMYDAAEWLKTQLNTLNTKFDR